MEYDEQRIDDAVLALLTAFGFDNGNAWKGFDFHVMNRLHAQGLISNPVGQAEIHPGNSERAGVGSAGC